jgi:ADP-heptose:LPS heptosyltransferase
VGQPGRPAIPRIDCPRWDGGFAVIHPFSGSPRKNWPLERYQQLARSLAERLPVRWCAGPTELLAEAVHIDDLYELACWLAGARLYIGNDSGITHLAAAVGTPVVALFGPSDPAIWAPRGPRVHIVATQTPGQPMDQIALEQALAAVSL